MRIPFPSVPQQPIQNGRYTAPAVVPQQDARGAQLANLGEGVARLGFEMSRRADWQQDQLDDAKITEADNLTADAAREVKTGFFAKIGRDATGDARKKADEDLDKRIERIGATLDNDVQRGQWKKRAEARRQAARAAMDGHETDQTLNYRKGSLAAAIEAARIDGLKPVMVKASRDLSALLGEDETQTRMRELDETTKYHEDRIRILAKSDPAAAAQMLTDASALKEIRPDRLDELQGLVQRSGDDEKALTLFRTIVADPTRQNMPLSEQERIARVIVDYERDKAGLTADVYKRTVAHIEYHFTQQKQLLDQQRKEAVRSAANVFSQDPARHPDSLPEEVREQHKRLGITHEVDEAYADAKALRLSGKKAKDSTVEENERLDIIEKRIKHIHEAEPPPPAEGASPEAAKAATDKFEEERKRELEYWQAMHRELSIKDRTSHEMPLGKAPKPDAKKPMEQQVREAIEEAWRVRSR